MKTVRFPIASLCTFLLFLSCTSRSGIDRHLDSVDSLLDYCPDTALSLMTELAEMDSAVSFESEAVRMRYRLLRVKAQDKAFVEHTSDSVILPILRYYRGRSDKRLLPEALYYAERVYSDLKDAPQSLEYFQQARELMEKEKHPDSLLLSKVCSQTGTLLLFQDVYEEAMKAYRQSYRYAGLVGDHRGVIFALRDIGETFTGLGNGDSALHYYKEGYRMAEEIGDEYMKHVLRSALGSLYKQLREYDKAKDCLNFSETDLYPTDASSYYSLQGDWHYQAGNMDSAFYYYSKVNEDGTLYAKQAASWYLADIARQRADYDELMKQLSLYNVWSDSIKRVENMESIRKMQSLYNYQLREKENKRLKAENMRQRLWNICMLSVLVGIILIGLVVGYRIRCKKLYFEIRAKELEKIRERQYEENRQCIEDNKQKIKELELKLRQLSCGNEDMRNLLEIRKKRILCANAQIDIALEEKELSVIAFRKSDIYQKFHKSYDIREINSQDWNELHEAIDATYKDFTRHLQVLCPSISEMQTRICMLIKADIPVSQIAQLVGRSKSAIVSARKRMYGGFDDSSNYPLCL